MVPQKALNGTHRRTEQCTWGVEQKRRRLAAEEESEVNVRSFSAYGRPLEMSTSYKYLGQVISAADYNWLAGGGEEFFPGQGRFGVGLSRILSREGSAPRVSEFFFNAVVQTVLLFGAENWVVTPRMGNALEGFQIQVAISLTGRLPWRTPDGRWRYTLAAVAREEAGFLTMEEYIRRRKNTVRQYIAT